MELDISPGHFDEISRESVRAEGWARLLDHRRDLTGRLDDESPALLRQLDDAKLTEAGHSASHRSPAAEAAEGGVPRAPSLRRMRLALD